MLASRRPVHAALAALALVLLAATPAGAGGVFLYEVGTPDMFTAGAGWAARAQDAATVFTNPAGMARLKGGDLIVGAGALYGDVQFSPYSITNVSGGDGGVAVGWLPNGGAYWAHEINPKWSFGLAATSNFGLSAAYDAGWVGRYYVEKSTLIGASFLPSFSYRMSPRFSLGASVNAMSGILKDDVAVNNALDFMPDGRMHYEDKDISFGVNVGALWETSAKSRVGVAWTGPVTFDFAARPEFTDVGPSLDAALQLAGLSGKDLGIGVTVPQTLTASFYSDLGPKWSLMGDAGWQDWSRFGAVDIQIATNPPSGLTTPSTFKDTWRGALGVKRRAGESWLLSAGFAYDSSICDDADRSLTFPSGPATRVAVGAQRRMSEKFELGFGYSYVGSGDLPVDQHRGPLAGRVAGAFDNTVIHVLNVQGHWTF